MIIGITATSWWSMWFPVVSYYRFDYWIPVGLVVIKALAFSMDWFRISDLRLFLVWHLQSSFCMASPIICCSVLLRYPRASDVFHHGELRSSFVRWFPVVPVCFIMLLPFSYLEDPLAFIIIVMVIWILDFGFHYCVMILLCCIFVSIHCLFIVEFFVCLFVFLRSFSLLFALGLSNVPWLKTCFNCFHPFSYFSWAFSYDN